MTRKDFPGGWYCDARPNGAYAVTYDAHHRVETHAGWLTPPERVLYVRLSSDGGHLVGVGHGETHKEYKDQALLGDLSNHWMVVGPVCGPSGVIFDAHNVVVKSDCGPGVGTQGYRYATSTGLVTGDATYSPKHGVDLHEWTDLGHGYRVGQGPNDNGAWFYDGALYHEVIVGNARFVRAHLVGDRVSIACYIAVNGQPPDAVIVWATIDELKAPPGVASPRLPVPDSEIPNVPPEPTPEPMPIDTTRLHAALQAERAKYPDTLADDEQAATIMNDALWTVRDEGWGLSAKPDGNRVWSREHDRYVSYDAVHHKPTDTIHDAATDEWPAMRIVAPHQVAHHGRADRPWLAPVQPFINNEQPPKTEQPLPEPPPLPSPGNTPVTCNCDLAPVMAKLDRVLAEVVRHTEAVDTLRITLENNEMLGPPDYTGAVNGTADLGWAGGKRPIVGTVTLTPKERKQ
jgi:hypothetical protein